MYVIEVIHLNDFLYRVETKDGISFGQHLYKVFIMMGHPDIDGWYSLGQPVWMGSNSLGQPV